MHPALPALLDRLIPADDFPSATQNGVLDFYSSILSSKQRSEHLGALDALQLESQARFDRDFEALQANEQDAILGDLEANQTRVGWPCEARGWLHQAAHFAAEGFYADPSNGANPNRDSWRMVGFERTIERPMVQEKLFPHPDAPPAPSSSTSAEPHGSEAGAASSEGEENGASSTPAGNVAPTPGGAEENALEAAPTSTSSAPMHTHASTSRPQEGTRAATSTWDGFDAIVIGAGAGGGAAACVLSEAGLRVLVVERGRDLGFDEIGRDHLRSQRLSLYGHNAGPGEEAPRVFVSPQGREVTVLPWQGGYQNNASAIGGGTRVYGAQAWRFMPQDFQMATLYGVPEGSSLADWPIGYDDLEPWYERAEIDLGVGGDSASMSAHHAPRSNLFPLPPLDPIRRTPILKGAAESLGWATFPTPLAIASRPYQGRGACVRCTECVGFACPSGAKAGSHNTHLPRAIASGATVIPGAVAAQIDVDARGQACGATLLVPDASTSYERISVKAKIVVLAAGAVESARLLLLSRSEHHPSGLGNAHDLVGRNLQGHYYAGAFGIHPDEVYENAGPGPSIATNRWSHSSEARSEGVIGGGMLADDFLKPPIDFWKSALPPALQRWGIENKTWMRENYKRTLQIMGPIQDTPSPHARVELDAHVRDAWGLPVARLSGTTHPESVRTADFLRRRAEEWLRAAGCEKVWSHAPTLYLSGGQHQAGTCRMSDDPKFGVCDRWGRVHGQDSLWVLDGSLHPTNGGFNPFLSLTALALRGADRIAQTM